MTELIQESTLAEYEAFVQSHPKDFAQSSLLGQAEARVEVARHRLARRGRPDPGQHRLPDPHHALYPQNDALRLPRPRLRS